MKVNDERLLKDVLGFLTETGPFCLKYLETGKARQVRQIQADDLKDRILRELSK